MFPWHLEVRNDMHICLSLGFHRAQRGRRWNGEGRCGWASLLGPPDIEPQMESPVWVGNADQKEIHIPFIHVPWREKMTRLKVVRHFCSVVCVFSGVRGNMSWVWKGHLPVSRRKSTVTILCHSPSFKYFIISLWDFPFREKWYLKATWHPWGYSHSL